MLEEKKQPDLESRLLNRQEDDQRTPCKRTLDTSFTPAISLLALAGYAYGLYHLISSGRSIAQAIAFAVCVPIVAIPAISAMHTLYHNKKVRDSVINSRHTLFNCGSLCQKTTSVSNNALRQ